MVDDRGVYFSVMASLKPLFENKRGYAVALPHFLNFSAVNVWTAVRSLAPCTRPSNPAGCATRAHGECCGTDDVLCRFWEGCVQGRSTVLDTLQSVITLQW